MLDAFFSYYLMFIFINTSIPNLALYLKVKRILDIICFGVLLLASALKVLCLSVVETLSKLKLAAAGTELA